jgi:hypothetical protein
MNLKRIQYFIFLCSLQILSAFALVDQEPTATPTVAPSENRKVIPSNAPERFKDDFLKMKVEIIPPIVKLSDEEIKWNQKFNKLVQNEIQKPLPKFDEIDPRLGILKKQNLDIPPEQHGEIIQRFFEADKQKLKDKLIKEKFLDAKETKRLELYSESFDGSITQIEDCLENGYNQLKSKNINSMIGSFKNPELTFKQCMELVKRITLIIDHVDDWDNTFKKFVNEDKNRLKISNLNSINIGRAKFEGIQVKQYNADLDPKKYQLQASMTSEFKNFISDMQKVVTKSQISLSPSMTPEDVIAYDAEVAKLYFLSDYLQVEELGGCNYIEEIKQHEQISKNNRSKPPIVFDKLYSIDISNLLEKDMDPIFREKWKDELLTIKKISEDESLDYYLFKEKNRDGWSLMIKDNRPNSISPYRVIQLKPNQNTNKFKPQTYQIEKVESQKKKADEKIKEETKLSEGNPKTRGSTDIVVLVADVMGLSLPINVLDVPKQMKVEAKPESNWEGTKLGYHLDPKKSQESRIFGSVGGKTDDNNFSISTGVFSTAGDLKNGNFMPKTKLDVEAKLNNGSIFNGDAIYNINNQSGFAKFELDGKKEFSLINYEKPGLQKMGKFHFETFSKDEEEIRKAYLKNPKLKEQPLLYERYLISDIDLDQKKLNFNYGNNNFHLGTSTILNEKEKSGQVQTKYLFLDKKGMMTLDGAFAEKSLVDQNKKPYKSHIGSGSFGLNLPTTSVNATGSIEISPSNSNTSTNLNLHQRFGKDMNSSVTQSNFIKLTESPERSSKSFGSTTNLNLHQSNMIRLVISNTNSQGDFKAPIDPSNPKAGTHKVGTLNESKEKYELSHSLFKKDTDVVTTLGYDKTKQIKNLNTGNIISDDNQVISGSVGIKRNIGTNSAILVTTGGKVIHHAKNEDGKVIEKTDGSAFIQTSAMVRNAKGEQFAMMLELEYNSFKDENKNIGLNVPRLGASYTKDTSDIKVYYDPSKLKGNQELTNTKYILGVEAKANLQAEYYEQKKFKPKHYFGEKPK